MKISKPSIKFKLEDLWIGIYWEKFQEIDVDFDNSANQRSYETYLIYICIFPCFPIHIKISRSRNSQIKIKNGSNK